MDKIWILDCDPKKIATNPYVKCNPIRNKEGECIYIGNCYTKYNFDIKQQILVHAHEIDIDKLLYKWLKGRMKYALFDEDGETPPKFSQFLESEIKKQEKKADNEMLTRGRPFTIRI
jgi:hypothetical protein